MIYRARVKLYDGIKKESFVVFCIVIAAGVIIDIFFRVIKYRDDLNKRTPQAVFNSYYGPAYFPLYQPLTPNRYLSVIEFLSGGRRRWAAYFAFRFIPPFVILILLAGVVERYYAAESPQLWVYILLASTISILCGDLIMIWKSRYVSQRILYFVNIAGVYLIGAAIVAISYFADVSFVAPSISGLFDNLWSTLLAASLVILYSRIMTPKVKDEDKKAEATAIDNYIFESYKIISNKYDVAIAASAVRNQCSKPILYAVLIYENMNRPSWMRKIENVIVGITRLELTLGIAQVRSDRVITDEESIEKAARILSNSNVADVGYGGGYVDMQQLEAILQNYNNSALYAESVATILSALRRYTTNVFPYGYGLMNLGPRTEHEIRAAMDQQNKD